MFVGETVAKVAGNFLGSTMGAQEAATRGPAGGPLTTP